MIFSRFFKLHYWPGITCAWFIITFIITYIIAVQEDHVHPFLPFISDTGSLPPESCIFGQMLNIGALLMGIVVYIRYRQVDMAINSNNIILRKWWNIISLLSGIIACLGISVIANFQQTALLVVHVVGAIMIFGNGAFYLCIQIRITFAFRHIYTEYPDYWVGPNILYFRIITTITFSILYCAVVICGFAAVLKFTGKTIICWTEEHGGYQEHLAATISEWIMVIMFFTNILSFTKEFKSLEYEKVHFTNKCTNKKPAEQCIA